MFSELQISISRHIWEISKQHNPGQEFDDLDEVEQLLHYHWFSKIILARDHEQIFKAIALCTGLRSLEVDLANAYCPAGCCRNPVVHSNVLFDQLAGLTLKPLRFVGFWDFAEKMEWQHTWDTIQNGGSGNEGQSQQVSEEKETVVAISDRQY